MFLFERVDARIRVVALDVAELIGVVAEVADVAWLCADLLNSQFYRASVSTGFEADIASVKHESVFAAKFCKVFVDSLAQSLQVGFVV
jgi:hypothetical protein